MGGTVNYTIEPPDTKTQYTIEPPTPPAPTWRERIENRLNAATEPSKAAPDSGWGAHFGTNIGNIEARAVRNLGSMVLHPIESFKGSVEMMGEFGSGGLPLTERPEIDPNAPIQQRVQQFRDEYAKDPELAITNAAGDVLGMYAAGKITGLVKEKVVGPLAKGLREKAASMRTGVGTHVRSAVLGPDVVNDLVDKTTTENKEITDANRTAEQKHFAEAQNAAHETRGREIAHQRGVQTAEEQARTESARLEAEHREAVQNALHETQGQELAHEVAVKATDEENSRVQKEHAQKVQTVEESNATKVKEYEAAKSNAEKLARDAREIETQRGKLARQVKEQSTRIVERIKSVMAQWKDSTELQKTKGYKPTGKLDKAYAEIRQATKGLSTPRETLANFVSKGEKMLKGSDENIKIFRDILGKASEEAEAQKGLTEEGAPESDGEVTKPADFSELQGYYSEIGEKVSSGNLPADVYRALRSVQEDIGSEMQQMAKKGGVGAKFKTTQAQYRDFMQTFRESAGPNHSGSPIAQALDASDPDYAIKPLTEESTAQRVRNMLSRFDPSRNGQGGAAQLYENFRNSFRQYEGLSKPIKVPELPTAPKLEVPPKAPNPKMVTLNTRTDIPERPSPVAPKYPEPPERVEPSDRPVETPTKKIGSEEYDKTIAEKIKAKSSRIRNYALMRSAYVGAISIPAAITAFILGHPGLAAEELAGGAASVPVIYSTLNGIANLIEKPETVAWLGKMTDADVAKIPPELRGTFFKPLVEAAAKKGIKVSTPLMQFVGAAATGPKTKQLQDIRDSQ